LSVSKLAFMVMPQTIRALIPLRFWPDFCIPCSTLFDIVFKYWDENEWEPGCGSPPSCMIEVLKQDIEDGLITKSVLFLHYYLVSKKIKMVTHVTDYKL